MPVAGGGFDQCYNAQAAVAAGSLLVVATDVVQAPNDKNQVEPMLEKIEALPEGLGKVEHLLADTGYFSAGNVAACEKAGVEPVIAMGRQPHHPPLSERFEKAPEAPKDPTPVEAMAHQVEDARRPCALRPAQTDAGAGVRHHQIRARIPSIFAARARKRARRVEPRDHGLEFEADVHPRPGLSNGLSRLAPKIDTRSRSNCINANPPRLRSRSIQAANSKIDIATQSQTTQSDRLLGSGDDRPRRAAADRRGAARPPGGARNAYARGARRAARRRQDHAHPAGADGRALGEGRAG